MSEEEAPSVYEAAGGMDFFVGLVDAFYRQVAGDAGAV